MAGRIIYVKLLVKRSTSVVLHAERDLRKPMDLRLWLGENHSDARRHREDFQRRHGRKDAVLCRV